MDERKRQAQRAQALSNDPLDRERAAQLACKAGDHELSPIICFTRWADHKNDVERKIFRQICFWCFTLVYTRHEGQTLSQMLSEPTRETGRVTAVPPDEAAIDPSQIIETPETPRCPKCGGPAGPFYEYPDGDERHCCCGPCFSSSDTVLRAVDGGPLDICTDCPHRAILSQDTDV